MRVLFLTPDYVLPANRGLRVRVLSQLQLLSKIEAVEAITLLSLSTTEVPSEYIDALERQLPKVSVEIPVVRNTYIRRSRRALLRFLYRRFIRNEPYLIATHNVPEMRAQVEQHLRSERYDVVYFGYLGMMAFYDQVRESAPGATLILEQHNLEWQIFGRLALSMSPPIRQLVQLEALALKYRERAALRQVDSVVAISDADAAQFRDLAGVSAVVVPPYIELVARRFETTHEPHLGYIGHLAWQPNVYGLDWFCKSVWALVRERVPQARLTIVGPGLHQDSSGALAVPHQWQSPGIEIRGYIENLIELYNSTLGIVAPVIGGSGVRMKILEAFSSGMPTITTTDGAAGLQVVSGRELLIADDPNEFADCVARVLMNPDLRERLRQGGYDYLALRHSESVAKAQLERAISVTPQRGNARSRL